MKSIFSLLLAMLLILAAVPGGATITSSPVGSHSLVITQFYVPGGNASPAPYTYNFIEIFNAGPVAIDLTDWTLQYQSATGSMGPSNTYFIGPNSAYTASSVTYPASPTFPYNNGFNGILQPGQYLLIQTPGQGLATPGPLPLTPDVVLTKTINGLTATKPSTSGGKYALVKSVSGIYCGLNASNPARSNTTTNPYQVLIGPMASDFLGYRSDSGSTPNCYEGNGPVYIKADASISSSKQDVAAVRKTDTDGCPLDTNNNGLMDTSSGSPVFSAADFQMMKIGPTVTNGWTLHNSTSYIVNGNTANIQSYTPTICPASRNTIISTVNINASVAGDATLAPVTRIEAGKPTQLVLTATVTDGGVNPTSAIGYRMVPDLSGLSNKWVENPVFAVPPTTPTPLRMGFLGLDPVFGNPQYQYPIPAENPPPTTLPTPVTFTINPPLTDKGSTYAIPVTVQDDGGRQQVINVNLSIVGSTPGAATLASVPPSVPATVSTPVALTATITDPGAYPTGTSFTVTMDLSSIGGSASATCPETSTNVYTCNANVTPSLAAVGTTLQIPVRIVDDQARTLTLTPTTLPIAVTAQPEPVANLSWVAPATGNFGSIQTGQTTASQTAKLTNTGLLPLAISSITATGDFARTHNCPASLDQNASCTITVTFTPTALGTRDGSLTVTDDSHAQAGSQQTLALTGVGLAPPPTADLSATSLTFANQIVTTTSAAQTVTLSNNGGLSLSILGLSLSGANASDFAYTTTCRSSLAPGANCTFAVTFKPAIYGHKTASLKITHNAGAGSSTVDLVGEGVDFPMSTVNPANGTLAIAAGQTAAFGLQISPAGAFTGTVTIACPTVIQAATCTVSPSTVNISGTSAVPVNVSIRTTARSSAVAGMTMPAAPGNGGSHVPLLAAVLSAMVAVLVFATSKTARQQWRYAAACGALLCAMSMTACQGLKTSAWPDQPALSTPAGTYTVTVTATYNAGGGASPVVRSTNLSLTVN